MSQWHAGWKYMERAQLMALFGFGKKKNDIRTPEEFYSQCTKEFHKETKLMGLIKRGPNEIPEILKYGETAASSYLNDATIRNQYGDEPTQYYFVIMSLCLQAGMVLARNWSEDASSVDSRYVSYLMSAGPSDEATKIMEKQFKLNTDQANLFYSKIFEKWVDVLTPYWNLAEPWEYTTKAMIAAYQLGVSMILEKK